MRRDSRQFSIGSAPSPAFGARCWTRFRAQTCSPALSNPFAAWHEGTDGDYQTIFIELWAYLADILTFYQERIANEAYLGTATQRDSSLRLAQLIDYRPSPGAGASGSVAFTVAR